jgi:hypothetical protein
VLAGAVRTDFADVMSAKLACKTPIQNDAENSGATCMQIKWSSACGYNFNNYMETWNSVARSEDNPDLMRPGISAVLEGNITVTTAWLGTSNITLDSAKAQRIGQYDLCSPSASDLNAPVNNITIAIPHRGVVAAARESKNRLIQPQVC